MATFRRFEEIEAWRKARIMTRDIYAVSKQGPFAKDFGLRDQIRSASVSVMSNIAEGFERGGRAEFLQFLSVAKSSMAEVRSQLYVAFDQAYISEKIFGQLLEASEEISRLIGGLMNYLTTTSIRGRKYPK